MRTDLKTGQDGFKTVEPVILQAAWAAVGFINALKKYKDYLRQKYKGREIGIFGSYAKNEQNRGSDLDVLVEFYEPVDLGYFELKYFLDAVLNLKVDLVTKWGIKPRLKDKILEEVRYL